MPIEPIQFAIAILMMVFVTGCAATDGGVRTARQDNWGEANRQTMAAQIIDPSPDYGDVAMTTSGDQVATALNRLRTGQVKKPERVKTTNVGSGSSN